MDRHRWVRCHGNLRGNSRDSLDFPNTVDHSIPGVILGSVPVWFRSVELLPLPEVQASNELSDNNEIDSLSDRLLQWAIGDEGVGGEGCRSNIGIQSEPLSESQDSLFRTDGTYTPFRPTDRAWSSREGQSQVLLGGRVKTKIE